MPETPAPFPDVEHHVLSTNDLTKIEDFITENSAEEELVLTTEQFLKLLEENNDQYIVFSNISIEDLTIESNLVPTPISQHTVIFANDTKIEKFVLNANKLELRYIECRNNVQIDEFRITSKTKTQSITIFKDAVIAKFQSRFNKASDIISSDDYSKWVIGV